MNWPRWIRNIFLTQKEREVLAIADTQDRWMPTEPITPEEAQIWGSMLRQPLMLKLDAAMISIAQMEAQRAIGPATATGEIQRQTGYAYGVRRGWEIAKAISVMVTTKADRSEAADSTGPANLDKYHP